MIISRDATWLNKNYGSWKGLPVKVTRLSKEESDSEEDEEVMMKRRDTLKTKWEGRETLKVRMNGWWKYEKMWHMKKLHGMKFWLMD